MSSVGPFPVATVIARLEAQVSAAKLVGTAADLDTAVETPPNASPALYVLAEERGGTVKASPAKVSEPDAPYIQIVDVMLKLVLLVRSVRGERLGTGARELADLVIGQSRLALLGWSPEIAFEPISFHAGRDDSYRGGWLAVQQILRSRYHMKVNV